LNIIVQHDRIKLVVKLKSMKSQEVDKSHLIKNAVGKVSNAFHSYEKTQPTTKLGIALITIGLISGSLGLAVGDPMVAGLCCNTISGAGAISLGISALNKRVQKK